MASNDCSIYTSKKRPIDAFVQYFLDVKPYHTKLLEVLEIYNFSDDINVTITESLRQDITLQNDPLCRPVGWGVNWDDECGFDAISCCDLFTCIGGYGLIFDNSDLLTSANIVTTATDGVVTVQGNHTYDYKIPIKNILNSTQFSVVGDFTGGDSTKPSFNVFNIFVVIPRHIYNIASITSTTFTVAGNISSELVLRKTFSIYGSAGNDGVYQTKTAVYDTVTNKTTIEVYQTINNPSGTGFIEVNANNKNNGAYQVTSCIFNGVETIVTINGSVKQFSILNDSTNGSVQLRTGLFYPRHITIAGNSTNNDGDYKIIESTYDYTNNQTLLTLGATLTDVSNTGTVNLYGYDFEAGFDADPECSVPKPSNVHASFSEKVVINVIAV